MSFAAFREERQLRHRERGVRIDLAERRRGHRDLCVRTAELRERLVNRESLRRVHPVAAVQHRLERVEGPAEAPLQVPTAAQAGRKVRRLRTLEGALFPERVVTPEPGWAEEYREVLERRAGFAVNRESIEDMCI